MMAQRRRLIVDMYDPLVLSQKERNAHCRELDTAITIPFDPSKRLGYFVLKDGSCKVVTETWGELTQSKAKCMLSSIENANLFLNTKACQVQKEDYTKRRLKKQLRKIRSELAGFALLEGLDPRVSFGGSENLLSSSKNAKSAALLTGFGTAAILYGALGYVIDNESQRIALSVASGIVTSVPAMFRFLDFFHNRAITKDKRLTLEYGKRIKPVLAKALDDSCRNNAKGLTNFILRKEKQFNLYETGQDAGQ